MFHKSINNRNDDGQGNNKNNNSNGDSENAPPVGTQTRSEWGRITYRLNQLAQRDVRTSARYRRILDTLSLG